MIINTFFLKFHLYIYTIYKIINSNSRYKIFFPIFYYCVNTKSKSFIFKKYFYYYFYHIKIFKS